MIAGKATADTAQRFVAEILDHIDGILIFPLAGRARGDVRVGVRTINFKKRTLIVYEIDESSDELVVVAESAGCGCSDSPVHQDQRCLRNPAVH